ncbi:diguanylate cyclase [Rhizobiaceae bacterium n13]|uniref:Diguanylate cyclase n=1 Tax=Ferirhizobium litorale TaxID=2927786 RepID=A0AAE3QDA9_9HYPH|nr:diguanylate cyclase [Fererhizobium litorale]MDI7861114.1 diguanylate cyclase [Fererhizobium litorale]MDI7921261.1 diguanylate cyclase [Fererhizobium litorale]
MHAANKPQYDSGSRSLATIRWFALDGRGVPDFLAASGHDIGVCDVALPSETPLIIASSIRPQRIVADTMAIREAIGEIAYLIVVPEGPVSEAWSVRALECGADDILLSDPLSGVSLCLARARIAVRKRRQALVERATAELERDYLQGCIDSLPTPIFFKNSNFVYVGCNNAFAEYIGRPVEEIIGRNVHDIAPEAFANAYSAADVRLLSSGGTSVHDDKIKLADGGVRDVSYHKAAITDAHGNVRGIAGCMLDITERKRLEAKLIDAAERDPLTNAYNRRKFFAFAQRLEAKTLRSGMPVSLAVIDIDHFKAVNDRWGHAEGDRILCDVARILEDAIGKDNFLARAGGEEFFAIFPNTTGAAAVELADKVRLTLAEAKLGGELGVETPTVSIGISEWRIRQESLWDAVKRADGVLYDAKHSGRDRVHFAG